MSLLLGLASVFVSDDASKILLITCRNKIFVWEMDGASGGDDILVGHCGIARNYIILQKLYLHNRFSLKWFK